MKHQASRHHALDTAYVQYCVRIEAAPWHRQPQQPDLWNFGWSPSLAGISHLSLFSVQCTHAPISSAALASLSLALNSHPQCCSLSLVSTDCCRGTGPALPSGRLGNQQFAPVLHPQPGGRLSRLIIGMVTRHPAHGLAGSDSVSPESPGLKEPWLLHLGS